MLAPWGAGAKPKLRTHPSTLTVFLGKRRCLAAESEPTVELAQLCHPEGASADDFAPEESRADRVVPRAARCWRSGLQSTDPTKSI